MVLATHQAGNFFDVDWAENRGFSRKRSPQFKCGLQPFRIKVSAPASDLYFGKVFQMIT
jgi:hypothetical protein